MFTYKTLASKCDTAGTTTTYRQGLLKQIPADEMQSQNINRHLSTHAQEWWGEINARCNGCRTHHNHKTYCCGRGRRYIVGDEQEATVFQHGTTRPLRMLWTHSMRNLTSVHDLCASQRGSTTAPRTWLVRLVVLDQVRTTGGIRLAHECGARAERRVASYAVPARAADASTASRASTTVACARRQAALTHTGMKAGRNIVTCHHLHGTASQRKHTWQSILTTTTPPLAACQTYVHSELIGQAHNGLQEVFANDGGRQHLLRRVHSQEC